MSSELIHTFPHPVPAAPSAITCLVQSPAIDVIGIGYLDGNVHIFDVRQGELVMQMKMEDGSCSSLSFRTGQSSTLSTQIQRLTCRWTADSSFWIFQWLDRKLGSQQRWSITARQPRSTRTGRHWIGIRSRSTAVDQFKWR